MAISNLVPYDFQNQIREILPNRFWQEFTPDNFESRESRTEIWKNAIMFISQKPIIGWGAAAFPILYFFGLLLKKLNKINNKIKPSNTASYN